MKALMLVAGFIFLFMIVVGSSGNSKKSPSDAELRDAVSRIFATCEQRVLGRTQAEGERISSAQASAITTCVDQMSGAYVAGVNAAR